jgi:hypothetical protein
MSMSIHLLDLHMVLTHPLDLCMVLIDSGLSLEPVNLTPPLLLLQLRPTPLDRLALTGPLPTPPRLHLFVSSIRPCILHVSLSLSCTASLFRCLRHLHALMRHFDCMPGIERSGSPKASLTRLRRGSARTLSSRPTQPLYARRFTPNPSGPYTRPSSHPLLAE